MTKVSYRTSIACALLALSAPVLAGPDRSVEIWKSAVPPVPMHGEFGNHDPIGLASGARIKVDCSLNWTDPDSGKLYCFNSPTSLNYFLEWPKANILRAGEAFARGPSQ